MSADRFEFASDNVAGLLPESWTLLTKVNEGCVPSYGMDDITRDSCDAIREVLESDAEVFFVFNGTAANSLAISHLCHSFHSVIAHELAHVETDECGGPEFFSNGTKLLLARGHAGKLAPEEVEFLVTKRHDIHYPKPRVISITTPTECGTVYTLDELRALREIKERYGLRVHLDGARFANAVASLGCPPRDILEASGADVLCFGGIKTGIALGEAVVFLDRQLAFEFDYRCKQSGQLASKMRFLCAPWAESIRSGRWLTVARHANEMAALLAARCRQLGFEPVHSVEANCVFLNLPVQKREGLRAAGWRFYEFIGGAARFMCHWKTRPEDVEALVATLKAS